MVKQTQRVLIMAGGTGGHVFPALAVAEYLREHGVDVYWLGTRRGLESQVVPRAGITICFISVSGLRGKGMRSWLLAPFKLLLALLQALYICLRLRPNAVLGMGGFVTGPGGLASWLLRRPLLIHEQNAIPGLTNRLLSHLATGIMEAFPGSFKNKKNVIYTGNPIRKTILTLAEPQQRFAQHSGPIRILVMGGSLGAQALNETVPAALGLLENDIEFDIWHQAGKGKLEAAQQAYTQAGVEARVVMFIDDMAEAFQWADLVICRAGALTVSELAAVGLGSILIPYPYAVDDHQTANARHLQQAGAAEIISQNELTAENMANILKEMMISGRDKLLEMAKRARQLAMPDATSTVARHCLEVMHG